MSYPIQWTSASIWFLVVVVLMAPIFISVGLEYLLTKKITLGVSIFVLILSASLFALGVIQVSGSKVIVNNDSITLQSLLYTRVVPFKAIDYIAPLYQDRLPYDIQPVTRKNGFGLAGYSAGIFKLKDNSSAFVLTAQPPFLMITINKNGEKLIFSANEALFNEINGRLLITP